MKNTLIPIDSLISATEPVNPAAGALWFDEVSNDIFMYDGTGWLSVMAQHDAKPRITHPGLKDLLERGELAQYDTLKALLQEYKNGNYE